MTAEFFVLAFIAAANPKLLALDLLLIENRRPRAMFAAILAAGLSVAITIGLVDVLVVRADALNTQKKASAGVDLAIGLLLLAGAALLLTGILPRPRRPAQSSPGKAKAGGRQRAESWVQRSLSEPHLLLALAIGAVIGLPGVAYLTALHNLVTGHFSTANQVAAVLVFAVIEFLLIIVPWLFVELWRERTASFLKRCQSWLAGHVKQLIVAICIALGAYLTISALVRLA